ncbi:MAG: hypothetical protein KAG43_01095 [Candidatus Marithrix sp.]|nr:hypothetical protein [Candidatus Marithrix sp.]
MKNTTIIMVTILLFFSGLSKASKTGEISSKILGAVVVGGTADLTKKQLYNCMLLQGELNELAAEIEQANSELKLSKKDIDKQAGYIKERRSQVKTLTNEQIKDFNKIITEQKQLITKYNDKIDVSKEKFTGYKIDKVAFNTDCADKSYNADDMEAVTAKIEKTKEEDKVKEVQIAKDDKKVVKKAKYSLTINLTPADSKVRIMNIGPRYQPGILLKPGKYDVYITNKNHQEYRKWVEIKDSDLNLDVILNKE